MQVASATTLITPNFLKNIPVNRERLPKIYHFPHLLRSLNPYIIQIAQSRSNPVLRGKQSWKVKQISGYAASGLSASKGVANDLFSGKTGKSSNMKAWLREEKSSTPITASMLLAKIHNPASRGSLITFHFPYAPQGQKDRCMLSAFYFISWKREKLDGQAVSTILLKHNWHWKFSQKKIIQVSKFSEIEDCTQTMFLSKLIITTVSSAITTSKKKKKSQNTGN